MHRSAKGKVARPPPLLSGLSKDSLRELFGLLNIHGQDLCMKANTATRLFAQRGLIHLDVSGSNFPFHIHPRTPDGLHFLMIRDPWPLASIFPNLEKITMTRVPVSRIDSENVIIYNEDIRNERIVNAAWRNLTYEYSELDWPRNNLAKALQLLPKLHSLVVPAQCLACSYDIPLLHLKSLILTSLHLSTINQDWLGRLPLMPRLKHLQRLFDSSYFQDESKKAEYLTASFSRVLPNVETLVWIGLNSLKPFIASLINCTRLILTVESDPRTTRPVDAFFSEQDWNSIETLPRLKELTFIYSNLRDDSVYYPDPSISIYMGRFLRNGKQCKIILNTFIPKLNGRVVKKEEFPIPYGITFLNRENRSYSDLAEIREGSTYSWWVDMMVENRHTLKTLVLLPQENKSMLSEPKFSPLQGNESINRIDLDLGMTADPRQMPSFFEFSFSNLISLTTTTSSFVFTGPNIAPQGLRLHLPHLKYLSFALVREMNPARAFKDYEKDVARMSISMQMPNLKHLVITERLKLPEDPAVNRAFSTLRKWLEHFLVTCPNISTLGININRDYRKSLIEFLKANSPPALEILAFSFKSLREKVHLRREIREFTDVWWENLRNIVVCKRIKLSNLISFDDNGEDVEPEVLYQKQISLRDIYKTSAKTIISINNDAALMLNKEDWDNDLELLRRMY